MQIPEQSKEPSRDSNLEVQPKWCLRCREGISSIIRAVEKVLMSQLTQLKSSGIKPLKEGDDGA